MQNFDVPAGKLVCFSTGEYSDYGITGHFVTLQPLTQEAANSAREKAEVADKNNKKEMEKYRNGEREDYPGFSSIHETFIAALIRDGFLTAVDVHEMHIGSYGEISF